ncbi:Chromobox -like protein 3 [Halotydeus destructor]|nr:Chromobox -like protein 3 [Halotydeus destructor]
MGNSPSAIKRRRALVNARSVKGKKKVKLYRDDSSSEDDMEGRVASVSKTKKASGKKKIGPKSRINREDSADEIDMITDKLSDINHQESGEGDAGLVSSTKTKKKPKNKEKSRSVVSDDSDVGDVISVVHDPGEGVAVPGTNAKAKPKSKKKKKKSKTVPESVSAKDDSDSDDVIPIESDEDETVSVPSVKTKKKTNGKAEKSKSVPESVASKEGSDADDVISISSTAPSTDSGKNTKKKSKKRTAPKPPKLSPVLLKIPEGAEIEAILDRWFGPSDITAKEIFYLVKYKGCPTPDYNDNDQWKHPMELSHVQHLVDEFEEKRKQEKLKNRKGKQPYWEIVDVDAPKESKYDWKKVEEEAKKEATEASTSRRFRHPKGAPNASEGQGSQRKSGQQEQHRLEKHDEPPRGWARGLEPEEVLGVTIENAIILYLIKWVGCDEADLVLGSDLAVRCPRLIINYLEPQLIEELEDGQIANPVEAGL